MKHPMLRLTAPLLSALLLLSSCGAQNTQATPSAAVETAAQTVEPTAAAIDTQALFSDRDLAGTYDESAAIPIQLNGDSASCASDAVTIEGSRVILSSEGVYLLSGTLTDGQIVVNAGESDKVQLVLNGVDVTSATSAPIYALSADKVFLTLADGTENYLANGGEYVAIDENNIDAVLFSKTDLTLNGTGSLTIQSPAGHGVVSKDELVITGGNYTITAANHGLSGKDSIAIADGSFTITSGKDGLHAENSDDPSLGFLYLAEGSFSVTAQGDAISAAGALQIDGGTFDLHTGAGSASVDLSSSEDAFGPMDGGQQKSGVAQSETTAAEPEADTVSQKGIKAEGSFTIAGGTFTLDTVDDSLHAGGDALITGGTFSLRSGDDAIHSDAALTIQNGSFTIPYCYEGIEGLSITVDAGTFDITSSDDGLNAAGGADSSGFRGPGGQSQDTFSSGTDSFILINGGEFTIVSTGDCVDSNGDLTVNGGTLDLTCNGSGNTALDCDSTYTNNGGTVTTNDGSEQNPGQMGGGMGGRGGLRGNPGTQPSGAPSENGDRPQPPQDSAQEAPSGV